MIPRDVIFSPEAEGDLQEIYDWVFENAGERTAQAYLGRPVAFSKSV